MAFSVRYAKNTDADIAYILNANHEIEGSDASLTRERLCTDILCDAPKARVNIFEFGNKPIGLILYSESYWASRGRILWISQLYIEPCYRGQFFYKIKRWILQESKRIGVTMIAWGTLTGSIRSNNLWLKAGAKNISESFQFWVKKL